MPQQVTFAISSDGIDFTTITEIENDLPMDQDGSIIKRFTSGKQKIHAQYVKIVAKNIGVCPSWHKGKGSKAWIFADEILIK